MRPAPTRSFLTIAIIAALPAGLAVLGGCATTEGVEQQQVYQLPDGVAAVDTFTTVATVTAIDAAKRRVTLTTPDGRSSKLKAGKDVDLGSLRVGEQIGVRVTEETAIEIRNDGTPASDAVAVGLAAVTDGQAGAVLEGEAVESSAKIVAIDQASRKITFQFADGTTKTLKAGKKSGLKDLEVGETVIVQYAVSVLIATSG
jgi:hypothetical protein